MSRKFLTIWILRALLVLPVFAIPAWAFDDAGLKAGLNELAQGVSQTAYTLSEREGTAERSVYDAAAEKADKAQANLGKVIASLETPEDLQNALEVVKTFGASDQLHSYTAGVAVKLLKDRAAFLKVELPNNQQIDSAMTQIQAEKTTTVEKPQVLLSRAQRSLVVVQMPIAEAVISIEDNKEQRRVNAMQALFQRHEIKVLGSAIDESGDWPRTNYYISGHKYVLEALIRNFGGQEVAGNLKAVMVLTAGGFWGKKSIEVTVDPKSPEKGTLSWYQAVLEKDPWKYMAETNYGTLSQLGKVEDLAGEQKLRIKNAKLEIWVIPANGTKRDVIYKNSVDYGDVYVSAH